MFSKTARTRAHPVRQKIGSRHYRRVLVAPPARTRTHPVRQKIQSGHHLRVLAVHPRRGPARRARRKLRPARQRRIRCVGATQARGRWNTCTARPLSTCSRQLLWSLREALPRAFPRQGVWRDRPEGSRRRALWPERGANQHQRMSQSGLSSPFRPQHPAVETPPQKRTSRVTINLTKLCPLRNENANLWRRWELAPALQS